MLGNRWPIFLHLRASRSHARTGFIMVAGCGSKVVLSSRRNAHFQKQWCSRRGETLIFKKGAFLNHVLLCRAVLDHLGGLLGHLRAISGPSWGHLGVSWAILGTSWGHLGGILGYLGPSWGELGASLGPSGAILGHVEASLGTSWGLLGHLGSHVGGSWANLGSLWGRCGCTKLCSHLSETFIFTSWGYDWQSWVI